MSTDYHNANQAKFMRGLAAELASRGATQAGIAWVLSALDPAHANTVIDAPTHDATAVATPQYVQELTIDPPSAYGQSWDCCIVTYGGDNTHCVYAIGPQGSDFSNLSTFVDSGIFTAVQSNPITVDLPLVVGSGPDPKQFQTPELARSIVMGRSSSRSLTIEYTGPTLEDGGTVVSAHFNTMGGNARDSVLRVSNNGVLVASVAPVISLRESDFPTVNNLFYAGPAREGIYLPQRVTTDPYAQVCVPNGATLPVKGDGMYLVPGNPISSSFLATDPNTVAPPPWSLAGVPPMLGLVKPSGDCFIDSTPPTVTIFRGLQPGASLLVKAVMSLAIVPQPSSIERPYVHPAALEDPVAIEAYLRMQAALPAAWPARYNFLGALGGILATIGRAVFPLIAPVARQVGVSLVTSAADEATRRIVRATEVRRAPAPAPGTGPMMAAKPKAAAKQPPAPALRAAPRRPATAPSRPKQAQKPRPKKAGKPRR